MLASQPAVKPVHKDVRLAMDKIIDSEDPLDAEDFDCLEFINKKFPTEQSLGKASGGGLNDALLRTKLRARDLDLLISNAVRDAAVTRVKTKTAVEEAKDAIKELFEKIKSIKTKAEESEVMVQELCSDIKKLDFAKQHLTEAITALERTEMLVSGVYKLEQVLESHDYREACQLVRAVKDLFSFFSKYENLPPSYRERRESFQTIQKKLKTRIFQDLREFDPRPDVPGFDEQTIDNLSSACDLVDVLNPEVKTELLEWVCKRQLQAYETIVYDSGLSQFDQRFHWLRRTLKKFGSGGGWGMVFPVHWNVPGLISKTFCEVTNGHIKEMLRKDEISDMLDVKLFVKTLRDCVHFERELQKNYHLPILRNFQDEFDRIRSQDPGSDEDLDPNSAEAVTRKYKRQRVQAEFKKLEQEQERVRKKSKMGEEVSVNFSGALSSAFEKYMHYYVSMERDNLENLVREVTNKENWRPPEVPLCLRFEGADDVLMYIQKSFNQCVRMGITGEVLFQLTEVYTTGIRRLTQVLNSKLPNPKNGDFGDKELIGTSLIVTTGEYVYERIPEMQTAIEKRVDEEFKSKIDFEELREGNDSSLGNLMNAGIEVLVTGIGLHLDDIMKAMQLINWANLEMVGDQSPYILEINDALKQNVSLVMAVLQSKNYRNFFCRNLCRRIVSLFTANIFRIRSIECAGAHQLQLDTQILKTVLIKVPLLGSNTEDAQPPASYKRFVAKEIGKLDGLLKTMATPTTSQTHDVLAQTFQSTLVKASHQDLQRICEIKGLKKVEIQQVLSKYNKLVPPEKQLAPIIALGKKDENLLLKLFKG